MKLLHIVAQVAPTLPGGNLTLIVGVCFILFAVYYFVIIAPKNKKIPTVSNSGYTSNKTKETQTEASQLQELQRQTKYLKTITQIATFFFIINAIGLIALVWLLSKSS